MEQNHQKKEAVQVKKSNKINEIVALMQRHRGPCQKAADVNRLLFTYKKRTDQIVALKAELQYHKIVSSNKSPLLRVGGKVQELEARLKSFLADRAVSTPPEAANAPPEAAVNIPAAADATANASLPVLNPAGVDESDSCSVQQAWLDRQEKVGNCQVHLPQRQHRNITKVLPHLNLQVLIHLPSRSTVFQRSSSLLQYTTTMTTTLEKLLMFCHQKKESSTLWNGAPLSRLHLHGQRCQTDAQCTETLFSQVETTSAWRLFHHLDEHGVFRT